MAIFGVFREIPKSVFRRIFYGRRNFDSEIFRKKTYSKVFKVIWTLLTDGVLFGISDLESDWRV